MAAGDTVKEIGRFPEVVHITHEDAGNGATTTAGSWYTRELETLEDPFGYGFATMPGSQQFTLTAGKYIIEGYTMFYHSNMNMNRIYNVTDAAVAFYGMASNAAASGEESIACPLAGQIEIAATKTFRVEGRVSAGAGAGDGLGPSYGVNNIFTLLKITKLA